MRGIKIPQQDFALKMSGGLMREGGPICGTLPYPHLHVICRSSCVELSRISLFCGYTRKFSPQNLGCGVLWRCKSEQSAKVFYAKIVFLTIRESFLPQKFPTIRYLFQYGSCYVDFILCFDLSCLSVGQLATPDPLDYHSNSNAVLVSTVIHKTPYKAKPCGLVQYVGSPTLTTMHSRVLVYTAVVMYTRHF